MKKFRFPLRSVATVRSLREMRAREQFSAAVQTYVAAEQQLKEIRARLTELEEMLRNGRGKTFRPGDEAAFLEAFKNEAVRATKAAAEASRTRAAMEAARQAWLESRRDVRVIEKLEFKARGEHAREAEREDQAALDDRTNALAARPPSEHS
jgi:flagellar export protein FliJ